jgi:oligoendopeptidase F
MSTATKPTSSADGVVWNLDDLYHGVDDPQISADLDAALKRAQAFEQTYRGQIHREGGPSLAVLLASMQEQESLYELMDKPLIYAFLLHAGKTNDPKHGALLSKAQEQRTIINKHLLFFDLEWIKVPDDIANALLARLELARFRHYLEQKRVFRPHYLSEPEEKVVADKSMTGRSAFVRLFDESVSTIKFPYEHDGRRETLTQQQILARLEDPDRTVRKAAAEGCTRGLQENARLLTYIFNTLVLDHQTDCTLRKYPSSEAPRHLANEITQSVVDALMTATERYHATVQRYYRLKTRLLDVGQLYDYDRYAPIFQEETKCSWAQGREIVEKSYAAFSPKAGTIIREFFARKWIDAELREGKRGGAFSHSVVPSVHPYILMNYLDRVSDVMTLAHELGHGLHQYLARDVGYLQCDTPLTTAETASVFGEMLTFQQLRRMFPDPRIQLSMLCDKIEDAFATVFRQVVLTRFEQSLHKARKEVGELPTEKVNELWLAANRPMHGDVVQLTEGYGWWWLYIGHFIHSPFYCYAYAFGELLVLALVQKYKQEGESFVPKYLDLLAAGGSEAPHVLLGKLGLDVNDPKFWELGLQLLDDMVSEAETLAAKL